MTEAPADFDTVSMFTRRSLHGRIRRKIDRFPSKLEFYSPDGTHIVSGAMDCTVRVWDVISGIGSGPSIAEHENDLVRVAFSPDGSRIVSMSYGGAVRVWDAMLETAACPLL